MGSSNLFLLQKSFRPSLYMPFSTAHHCNFFKFQGFSHQSNGEENKEDFLHLARNNDSLTEKTSSIDSKLNQKRKANEEAMADQDQDQGLASQTVEKVQDGAAEALNSHPKVDAVKDRYKDHEPGADYHKTGDKLNHEKQ
ncbi:hypothetical protein ES319_D05G415500v1 [Gossypium barbadense]|uniref:Uncharacterized protein n=1 Tax=Gossypium barbadense TaxID=3634 RepID=A0A5J5RP00_GOSBA|nr:hypothetical protein ES319_D05G415500v1 [Gossypium barbadense]